MSYSAFSHLKAVLLNKIFQLLSIVNLEFKSPTLVVKDKCYADKPVTIDALKDNIREAIGEIQLHTIDNVLKNCTDRVGYYMASRGSHLNKIIFHY